MTAAAATLTLIGLSLGSPAAINADEADELPVVVLIGDSIRLGYAPYVAEMLEGTAKVLSYKPNGGDSSNVLAHLDEWAIAPDPDVIHLNAGLHDLRFDPESKTHQVEPDAYKKNLETIFNRLEDETDATLLFATTTPVLDDRHNAVKPFHRYESDVERYNAVARQVLKNHPEVKIDDLHDTAKSIGLDMALVSDGVHFTPAASRQLARRVADEIKAALARRADHR